MTLVKRKINKFWLIFISFIFALFLFGKDHQGLRSLEKQSKNLIQKEILKVTYADHDSGCDWGGSCSSKVPDGFGF